MTEKKNQIRLKKSDYGLRPMKLQMKSKGIWATKF